MVVRGGARAERLHPAVTGTVSRLQRMDAGPREFLTATCRFLSAKPPAAAGPRRDAFLPCRTARHYNAG